MRKILRARHTLIGSALVPAEVEVDTGSGLIAAVRTGEELRAADSASGAVLIEVPGNLGRLEELWEQGVRGFTCFSMVIAPSTHVGLTTCRELTLIERSAHPVSRV